MKKQKPSIPRTKHTIDATGLVAGRLATKAAVLLQGKHKVSYQPHIDAGDYVTVENVRDLKFTGKKVDRKMYHRFTGYPGGIVSIRLSERFKKNPEELFRAIVYSMLPKNKLRAKMIKRLLFSKKKKS